MSLTQLLASAPAPTPSAPLDPTDFSALRPSRQRHIWRKMRYILIRADSHTPALVADYRVTTYLQLEAWLAKRAGKVTAAKRQSIENELLLHFRMLVDDEDFWVWPLRPEDAALGLVLARTWGRVPAPRPWFLAWQGMCAGGIPFP